MSQDTFPPPHTDALLIEGTPAPAPVVRGVAACSPDDVPRATQVLWRGETWPRGIFSSSLPFPEILPLLPVDTPVAHCVSAEFTTAHAHLPARGFAEHVERFGGRPATLPARGMAALRTSGSGQVLIELVTKDTRRSRPSLADVKAALQAAVPLIAAAGGLVCVPRLGSGLDGLAWSEVRDLIGRCWADFSVVVLQPDGPDSPPLPIAPVAVHAGRGPVRRDTAARDAAVTAVARLVSLVRGPWVSSDPRLPVSPSEVLFEPDEWDWFSVLRDGVRDAGSWWVVQSHPSRLPSSLPSQGLFLGRVAQRRLRGGRLPG